MKLYETRILQEDLDIINEVLQSGNIGFGSNVPLFEERFKVFSGKRFNVATNSASASAFMIFSFLKEKYGICDVYTTSLGFTSPAWAAKHFGHNIVFVDVREDLQFDLEDYKRKRKTNRTQILMPVLYGGVSNIEGFDEFYDLKGDDEIVVVDSAHCVTPTIKNDFIFFSFHPYKPICTSDGGMISINSVEASEYFRSYRNFGRELIHNSYTISREGFKFYMNNLNATIGLTQLDRYFEMLEVRRSNFDKLKERFDLLPHDEYSSFYFATCLTDEAGSVILQTGLTRNYPMLHKMEYYNNSQVLPNLEDLHNKILNLPLWCAWE